MSRFEEALGCFEKSLELNQDYEKASSWREKVLQELNPLRAPITSALPVPPAPLPPVIRDDESSNDE